MDVKEFEEQLTELESRVDRLRALYENWFRGYEKLEPTVARKDVERRVYALRKELPRNTALRFRYHQLYQRYTTLSSYWGRTARQIEDGTHRFQLQRLRRKKDKEKLLSGLDGSSEAAQDRGDGEDRLHPGAYELNLDESLSIDELLNDLEMDEVARAVDKPAGKGKADAVATRATFGRPIRASNDGAPAMRDASGASNGFGDADVPTGLHVSFDDEAPAKPKLPPPAKGASTGTHAGLKNAPGLTGARAPGDPRSGINDLRMNGTAPGASEGERQAAAGPTNGARADVPPPPPMLAPKSAASSAASAQRGTAPAMTASSTNGARPPVPLPVPGQRPAAGRPEAAPSNPGGTFVGRPPMASPIADRSGSASSLSDLHLKRIYDEYVAARKRNNEADVRYESLVGSIQKMLPDLQKKHAGKLIDFEVVVKNGRVGLKPKPT